MFRQHKALLVPEPKGNFTLTTIETHKPGPGEVLAQVQAVSLNPGEWKAHEFGILYDNYPAIFGNDAASIVKEVGEGVTNVAVGDRIVHQGAYDNRHSVWQQYAIAPADLVAKIPPNLSFEQAAALPVVLSTAAMGLYNNSKDGIGGLALTPPWAPGGRGKYAGVPIAILGGAAGVGQQAIQFARLSGFSPIITTASAKHESYLKSLGATHVIDRTKPRSEILATIKQIAKEPLKYAFEAIGDAETQTLAYETLAPGGRLVVVLPNEVDKAKLTSDKEVIFTVCALQQEGQRDVGRELYKHLTALLEAGDIKPNNIEVVPGGLAAIPGALERLKSGVSALKLVIRVTETS